MRAFPSTAPSETKPEQDAAAVQDGGQSDEHSDKPDLATGHTTHCSLTWMAHASGQCKVEVQACSVVLSLWDMVCFR